MLKENRGLIKYILLSAVTFGVYALWTQHKIAQELNTACYEDGKHTNGVLLTALLSVVTLGIYSFVWLCGVGNRINNYSVRHGIQPRCTGSGLLLWEIFGTLLFGIGPFVAFYKLLHGMNDVNANYNREHLTNGAATLNISCSNLQSA